MSTYRFGEDMDRVLDYVQSQPGLVRAGEVQSAVAVSRDQARKYLSRLVSHELIERLGRGAYAAKHGPNAEEGPPPEGEGPSLASAVR